MIHRRSSNLSFHVAQTPFIPGSQHQHGKINCNSHTVLRLHKGFHQLGHSLILPTKGQIPYSAGTRCPGSQQSICPIQNLLIPSWPHGSLHVHHFLCSLQMWPQRVYLLTRHAMDLMLTVPRTVLSSFQWWIDTQQVCTGIPFLPSSLDRPIIRHIPHRIGSTH